MGFIFIEVKQVKSIENIVNHELIPVAPKRHVSAGLTSVRLVLFDGENLHYFTVADGLYNITRLDVDAMTGSTLVRTSYPGESLNIHAPVVEPKNP